MRNVIRRIRIAPSAYFENQLRAARLGSRSISQHHLFKPVPLQNSCRNYHASSTGQRVGYWTRGRLLLWGSAAVAVIAYFAYPINKYPEQVADLIRLGLYAERKTNDPERFKNALQYYLAAVTVADHLGMSKVLEEYTGLQIKIGQMYEEDGQLEDALSVYDSILTTGLAWLQEDPRRLGEMPMDQVRRYLLVSVRAAEMSEHIDNARRLEYMSLLGLWITTLQKRLPPADVATFVTPVLDIETDSVLPMVSYHLPTDDGKSSPEVSDMNLMEVLLLARDYYGTLCVQYDRPGVGFTLKDENIRQLQQMKMPLPQILRIQVDIGSAYVTYYEIQNLENPDKHESGAEQSLMIAKKCFQDVINSITELRESGAEGKDYNEEDREDVDIAQSLAVFGLAVVEARQRNYSKALKFLKEARIRARGAQLPELTEKIKEEWALLAEKINGDKIMDTDALAEALASVETVRE
ncbi:hypothetical protein V1512DRAFT_213614 [Lipomyces arxii]|uniref:uncharacterized protein n=1 Tax=Lipomyces arxii TaxID=56418 RepID=UPI0034CFA1F8